jgi:arylsulfatase A-like enzyme
MDAYDGAIAYLDAELGALFDSLERRGVLRNTIVVITSDHGEEFGEHGLLGHGNSLYWPSLAVPLIVIAPGQTPAGVIVREPVTTRDVAASVADLTGIGVTFPGRSLARHWVGSDVTGGDVAAGAPDTLLSHVRRASGLPAWYPVSRGSIASALLGPLHVIRDGRGTLEVYDVERDPWERTDLAPQMARRSQMAPLAEVLRRTLAWRPGARP